ncbi:MAG: hypothetical protein OXQ89_04120 [Rhodospirillaceae bacterium]|nr:hypothetical protein [Rhodospirillaceae bacterium]MDD9996911.1 hypothetical protein [Rhodospirillaceae bacterium]
MLRLELNGVWEPEDFIEVFSGMESLYYKAAITRSLSSQSSWPLFGRPWLSPSFRDHLEEANCWFVSQARAMAMPDVRMTVARIEYASPGSIDLLGFGKALEVVCDAVARIVVFYSEGDLRQERDRQARIETDIKQTELEMARESLRAIKLDNARKIMEMSREFPDWSEEMLVSLAVNDQDKLIPCISERKLTGIKSMES